MTSFRKSTIVWLCLMIFVATESAVLIADMTMSRMIELLSKRPFCKLHTDRGVIQKMLLKSDQKRVRYVPLENVKALERECKEAGGLQGEIQGGLGFIYPGTKWCGPGSIATEYSDVGRYAHEDRCCREHDLCPYTLAPGECKRGLCNHQQFTRSHCDCDAKFRRCLQGLNTETANTLGAVFFNVVQVTCFKERRPCSVYQSIKPFCPLEYFKTEPFISLPLLLALDSAQVKADFVFEEADSDVAQRSFYLDGFLKQSRLFNNDFTREASNASTKLDNDIRLASLGFAARSIFKDVVIRPFTGFARFFQLATNIWDKN